MNPQDRYHNLYLDFYKINPSDFRKKIDYYEKHKGRLSYLDYTEKTEMHLDYTLALFETGKYKRFLALVDELIKMVICEDLFETQEKAIFKDLLFKKAASYYNLGRINEAEYITKELVKIDPQHEGGKAIFTQCSKKKGKNWYKLNKAISIVLVFTGISFYFIEFLIVEPFYQFYLPSVQTGRNFILGAAIGLLIINEFALRLLVRVELRRYTEKALRKRR